MPEGISKTNSNLSVSLIARHGKKIKVFTLDHVYCQNNCLLSKNLTGHLKKQLCFRDQMLSKCEGFGLYAARHGQKQTYTIIFVCGSKHLQAHLNSICSGCLVQPRAAADLQLSVLSELMPLFCATSMWGLSQLACSSGGPKENVMIPSSSVALSGFDECE